MACHDSDSQSMADSGPILVIDNGSCSIKAGFAGSIYPAVVLNNCVASPLRKQKQLEAEDATLPPQASGQTLIADDIFYTPEYVCTRPFEHGLLVDISLQSAIWDVLFSKTYLNLTDFPNTSLLLTEHFNTPASVRYALVQLVFEEFGFNRLLITPGQQLVPCLYANATETDTEVTSLTKLPAVGRKTKAAGNSIDWSLIKYNTVNDAAFNLSITPDAPETFCQLVVDVGHQTLWVVPMYGELVMDFAIRRADFGGAEATALLKNLLAYNKLSLQHNELLVQSIKEDFCFTSLNYAKDLALNRAALPYSTAVPPRHYGHLTQRCLLPNYSSKDKSILKKRFTQRSSLIPPGQYQWNDNTFEFDPLPHRLPDLTNMLDSGGIFDSGDQYMYLDAERIRVPELIFHPSDYFEHPHLSNSFTNPANQCGLPDLILHSIFSCPPVLQPLLASRILLTGGGSHSPNFAKRLYLELRKRLPQAWSLNILKSQSPVYAAWQGGSIWSCKDNNYSTFCITRQQYLESK